MKWPIASHVTSLKNAQTALNGTLWLLTAGFNWISNMRKSKDLWNFLWGSTMEVKQIKLASYSSYFTFTKTMDSNAWWTPLEDFNNINLLRELNLWASFWKRKSNKEVQKYITTALWIKSFKLKMKCQCQQEMEYHIGLITSLWLDLLRWPEKFSSSLNCPEKDVLLQTDLLWLLFQKWFFYTTKDIGLKKGYLENSSLIVMTLQS